MYTLCKVYGDFFKHSRADNSAARGRIWLNFELVRALMYVAVPCKFGKDPIENSEDNAWTTFSPYKVYGDFFKRSRTDTSAARGLIWLNFKLNRDLLCVLLFLASTEKIQLKKANSRIEIQLNFLDY